MVEDDPLIALDLAMAVEDAGGTALTAHGTEAARALIEGAPADRGLSGAVLDVDPGGRTSDAIADRLREGGVPHVLHTARPRRLGAADAPTIAEPASLETVVAALRRAIDE